jgi:5'-3' exonuclease
MRGDASDGLPGVSGIGDKTAASLLKSYHDLEGILAAASGPKPKISGAVSAKLSAAIDYLAVAPAVVAVVRDLDLGVTFDDLVCPTAPAKPDVFAELIELLGLGGSADRIVTSLAKDP